MPPDTLLTQSRNTLKTRGCVARSAFCREEVYAGRCAASRILARKDGFGTSQVRSSIRRRREESTGTNPLAHPRTVEAMLRFGHILHGGSAMGLWGPLPTSVRTERDYLASTPTSAMCNSSSCLFATVDGASVQRSVPFWVLGNAITSRKESAPHRSMASLSRPAAIPP